MLGRRQRDRPLDGLSPRERDVLAAMAEGKCKHGIAQALSVSQAAVEKHARASFTSSELLRVKRSIDGRRGSRLPARRAERFMIQEP
jgi:FixJ family two-component response regulator